MNDTKRNKIAARVSIILSLIERHGGDSIYLRNYISDCMESDIRREKKATKELLGIINGNPCEYQLKRKG